MRAGETDKAITRDLPEVREMGRKIGEALGHIGNLDCDIMVRELKDESGELRAESGELRAESLESGDLMTDEQIKAMLQPKYGLMFAKNDYLMPIE